MKMLKLLLIPIFFILTAFANVGDVRSGDAVTLDGTVQKISFRGDHAFSQLLYKNGCVTVMVRVNGAGGCKVSNQSTLTGSSVNAQDKVVFVTIVPNRADLHVQGTNTETITVTY